MNGLSEYVTIRSPRPLQWQWEARWGSFGESGRSLTRLGAKLAGQRAVSRAKRDTLRAERRHARTARTAETWSP